MANAVAKIPFSGSTQGRGIKVVATATAGTTLHTTGTSATIIDEVWLWLYNGHTADVVVTIELGGVTVPDDVVVVTVPFKSGLMLAVPGFPLLGSGAASLVLAAFASVANVVTARGFVNRITP